MDSTPSLFPLFEGQLKQNLVVCKYVTNSIQNRNKIDYIITGPLLLHHLCFWGQSPSFDQHFIFRPLTLQVGIACVNFAIQNKFYKKGFM